MELDGNRYAFETKDEPEARVELGVDGQQQQRRKGEGTRWLV
jgi:hypothetical protein